MKTRNIIAILAALPIMAGVVSCKSDDETTAKPAKEILKVEGGGIVLPASQNADVNSTVTASVNITADCSWKVLPYDGGDFGKDLSVQPERGTGNGTLVITIPRNMTVFELRDTITLESDGGLRQRIPIRQSSASGNMSISASKLEFNSDGICTTLPSIIISSNLDWTIETPTGADWFVLTDYSGNPISRGTSGSTAVNVTVTPNMTDAPRSSFFNVKYKDETARVEITQMGMTEIYLNTPEPLSPFPYQGGEQMLRVDCNAEWHAYMPASVDWVKLEPAQGVGSREIKVTCVENNVTSDRVTAIVIISGSKDPKQSIVVVNQVANGSQVPLQTSVSLYEISVLRTSANFLFSIVSEEVVGNFGLVYSTNNQNPTRGNAEEMIVGRGGTSQGVAAELSGLRENTEYFVRAFVEKPSTGATVYSNVVPVRTMESATTLGMLYSMSVGNTSAEFTFNFISDEEVGDYGLVYSPTNNVPTLNDGVVLAGRGGTTHSVLAVLPQLQETTTYYVRAYVMSLSGTPVYGPNVVTITTSASKQEPGSSDNPSPILAPKR